MTTPMLTDINWNQIDSVLLDMDGTLLDLAFDTRFWLQTLPAYIAEQKGVSVEVALEQVVAHADSTRGTLDWYCLDHWTQSIGVDIRAVKSTQSHLVSWLPGAQDFLRALSRLPAKRVLATNAHPFILAIKQAEVQVQRYFDRAVTSHDFDAPKEYPEFWQALERSFGIDLANTVLVDDSINVLEAAQKAGVGHLIEIMQPDSIFGKKGSGTESGLSVIEVGSVAEITPHLP
ncbi:MAG: HAD-IA family hydrolase [Gammaproteobacteria bacterium]